MENQSQAGRPTVVDESTVAKLTEAFRLGSTDILACDYAGIDRSTFYRHLESDSGFATKINISKTYVEIQARGVVVREIEKGNVKASMWWLERRTEEFDLKNKELKNETSKLPFDQRLQEMFK